MFIPWVPTRIMKSIQQKEWYQFLLQLCIQPRKPLVAFLTQDQRIPILEEEQYWLLQRNGHVLEQMQQIPVFVHRMDFVQHLTNVLASGDIMEMIVVCILAMEFLQRT